MTTRDAQQRLIYQRLVVLAGDLTDLPAYRRSESYGFMPLSMDRISESAGRTVIALAHNYECNGDLVADPDMEIAIYTSAGTAEALAYQDQRAYHRAYDHDGRRVDSIADPINDFLALWLDNLIAQGHDLTQDTRD